MFKPFLLLAAATVPAAGPLEVATAVMAERVAADGATELVRPARVVPGDRVVVVLDYRNTGREPLRDVVLANPVPQGMVYRAPAAGTAEPEVSVDGTSFGPLGTLTVRGIDGRARAATPDDVRAVRWRVTAPIAAGAAGRLAFRAVLK